MDYVQVIRDFRSGVLDKEKVMLRIDNDGGYWDLCPNGPISEYTDEQYDAEQDAIEQLEEKYGVPGGYNDIVEVLCAAGVTADWV